MANRVHSKYKGLASFLERFLSVRAGDYCSRLKYFVTEKISAACSSDVTLSAYDVDIFEAYDNIMQAYKMVAEHHVAGEKILENPQIRQIWEGIYALIMSRLMAEGEHGGDNPILAEKKGIVADGIAEASRRIDELFAAYKQSDSWNQLSTDAHKALIYADYEAFAKQLQLVSEDILGFVDELYAIYVQNVESILNSLNNFETRSQASAYNNLLKEEIEILRQIIVVQAVAVEKAIWQKETTPEETEFLSEALTLLRETYQQEGQAYNAISKAFMEAAVRHRENMGRVVMDVEAAEDFAEELAQIEACPDMPVVYEGFKILLEEKFAPLKKLLNEFMFTHLESFDSNLSSKKVYFLKKAAWQAGQIAEECALCFADIVKAFVEHEEYFAGTPESDILRGVAQTIEIKVETMKEATKEFFEDSDSRVEDFFQEAKSPAGREGLYAAGEDFVLTQLLELGKGQNGAQVVQDVLDKLLESDGFEGYKRDIERAWEKRKDVLNKKILTYKRDNLFFELSTFEEIMHYSVSRLRESADEKITLFVAEIDIQHKKLDGVLARHGIEKIVPVAHEQFNAKEHEVLMAEENEGFKKGEIIKTMNSGYRQGGQLIVRANVIAAR